MTAGGLFLSTDLVEPCLRTEAWREITRPFFQTSVCPELGADSLEGSLTSRAVGTLLIGPTTFNHQQYSRDRCLLLQSGLDHYLVQLFVAGSLQGDCEGVEVAVEPGDICVFDLGRTFASRVTPGSTVSAVLPRDKMDQAANGQRLHGAVLKADAPVTRLLADFIVSLCKAAADMEHADALAVEDSAIALLAAGLARQETAEAAEDPALTHILRRRVIEFIDANLAQPELGPAMLMRRFHVSRTHLYRMFASDGGVAKVVREKRLDAAYRDVTKAGKATRSITDIAYGWGFSSSTQFLRAFRARFGMTPTEARQKGRVLTLADSGLSNLQSRFADYAARFSRSAWNAPSLSRTAS
jgi:AraC-like DNA-binding protein